ncbi:hypothetical protein [Streptomyces rugosispiralis]|uniref:hypothetical protein n=1 Tax=Streptomyces rugosispiralis TaxID=2967341 RepID=UPI0037041C71
MARCPVGTIRSRVVSARETLIAQLASDEEQPADPERAEAAPNGALRSPAMAVAVA